MEIDETINKWFEQVKQKLTGGKTYYKQVQLDVDKLCGWVVTLLENYAQSVLLLLSKGRILPAKALLRVISDVCIKCKWCLKGLETSEEEFTNRFDRWLRSSISEYKTSLERQLSILESEYGDEVASLKDRLRKQISEIEVTDIKKEKLLITNELISETWDTQSKLNVEVLYRRFHEAVHPDLVLFKKMLKESERKVIYKGDVNESAERVRGHCLAMLGYLFEAIYSMNQWDFSEFEEDIKKFREHAKEK